MNRIRLPVALAIATACAFALGSVAHAAQESVPPRSAADDGFTDTPLIPGQAFHVHDPARPQPPIVKPAATPGAPPSDAVVLFGGRDLSRWGQRSSAAEDAPLIDAKWPVREGWFEVGAGTGDLYSRERFGDVQVHVEWASPAVVKGNSQGRGNSGLFLMGLYEVQILDVFDNRTYADGNAGALYGQWPPLANVARPPGEWQSYDIVFEAPRFDGSRLVSPAYLTLFWNGVLVHNRKALLGPTVWRNTVPYAPHAAELPLKLQDHGNPVRFRNVWVRRLSGYDAQAGR
ncbi:DUF1080 domain-containing protein [Burkholderiaceae bacterium UC74_6]